MELMRYGHDVWGEKVLNGASWDLIPAAFWAGVAVIALHLIYRATVRRRQSRAAQSAARTANNSSGS